LGGKEKHGDNVNIIATSQTCEASISAYFVSKDQIAHPLTVIFSQVFPERTSSFCSDVSDSQWSVTKKPTYFVLLVAENNVN
jgi:hypothetical protein